MKSRKLIGRRSELDELNKIREKDGFRFVIVTGRRRIGKTRLVKEFVKDKDHFRVQFEKRNARNNLLRLNREIGRWANIPTPNFDSFTDAFEFLAREDPKMIVLDEFSYLIRYSDALAEFQTIVDEVLWDREIMLIVSGSSYSIMKRGLLEHSSPLYGRSDAMLNVQPLNITDLHEWYPKANLSDLVRVHSLLGGVPRYLELLDETSEVQKRIESLLFDRNSYLFREAKEVLEEEFDDPSTYYSVLEAVSRGSTTVTEIGNQALVEPKNVAKYLDVLTNLGILRREFPFKSNRKRGIYVFRDPYFCFWFKFVSPYFEDIESGYDSEARSHFKADFDPFVGYHLEKIAPELAIQLMPFEVESYGRWWNKGTEIDLVLEGKGERCFMEVKWGKTSRSEANRIIDRLKGKSSLFPGRKKRTFYGILGRKIAGKEAIRGEDVIAIDFEDVSRVMMVGE